jgi:WD40 repeat protein
MKRFALYSRTPIELAPLQVYSSTLMFAPSKSLVRRQFVKQFFQWVKSLPQVNNDWSTCLQTLEGHGYSVNSVAFSHDSARLASASDRTVKIWDASRGACLQTLERHGHMVNMVGFETQQPLYQGIDISSDQTWITRNAQNWLWLPLEYRPSCSTVSGRCLGVGTRSGMVWTFVV